MVHSRKEEVLAEVVRRVEAAGRQAIAVTGNIRSKETADAIGPAFRRSASRAAAS